MNIGELRKLAEATTDGIWRDVDSEDCTHPVITAHYGVARIMSQEDYDFCLAARNNIIPLLAALVKAGDVMEMFCAQFPHITALWREAKASQ